MNKYFRISNVFRLAVLALAVAGTGTALAVTEQATSTGVVVAPIQLTKAIDLSFGNFAAGATPGTVALGTDGTRGMTGGVVGMGGTPAAAKFDVAGQTGATYGITVVASALTSGGNTMAFAPAVATTASASSTGVVATGTLTGGTQSIYVGGVLTVAANQVAGTYGGTINATVEYN